MEFQYTTYKADVTSFELRGAMLGLLESGRYRGYDTFSDGGTVANVITVNIAHTNGAFKKPDDAYPTPVLGDDTGVIITSQGTIIHNDDTDLSVDIDDGVGQGSDRYDLIYLEHVYVEIEGANPSTLGVKKGTGGGGVPTLDNPTKQVPIALVEIQDATAAFIGLTITIYKPAMLGDYDIDAEIQLVLSTLQTSIGTKTYTEQNYITNSEPLATSLDKLDISLKDSDDAIGVLQNTKLDDWATPDDNTDLNASITRHGLLPKLPGDDNKFLNGVGVWVDPVGGKIVMRTGSFGVDESHSGPVADSIQLDFSTIVPADCDVAMVSVRLFGAVVADDGYLYCALRESTSGGLNISIRSNTNRTGSADIMEVYGQGLVPLDANRKCYIVFNPTTKVHIDSAQVTVIGWQTFS